jgi:hypothetical protein
MDFVAAMERCSVREAALQIQEWFGIDGCRRPSETMACPVAMEAQLVRKKEGVNSPLRFALTGVDHTRPYLALRGIDRSTATSSAPDSTGPERIVALSTVDRAVVFVRNGKKAVHRGKPRH